MEKAQSGLEENNIIISSIYQAGDYGSEFEYDSEEDRKRKQRKDLAEKSKAVKTKVPSKEEVSNEYVRDQGITNRYHLLCLDAYSRHKKYINDYLMFFGGSAKNFQRDTSKDKTDYDVLKEHHQFLWDDDTEDSWEKRLAKKYYDKLFKEYCIADLTYYKSNKIAMRWRTEKEVIVGKGQFTCGEKHCSEKEGLRSWEVNFAYTEQNIKKNALVKIRLCPECSYKLNYKHKRKEILKKRHAADEGEGRLKQQRTEEPSAEGETANANEDHQNQSSDKEQKTTTEETLEKRIWGGAAPVIEEKSRHEEFEDYFEDMFL